MKRVAALLAAVLASAGLAACGGDGAEPGAPRGATLVLDFQPNAVHAGIYSALAAGLLPRRRRRPARSGSHRRRPTPPSCSRPAGRSSRSSTSTTWRSPASAASMSSALTPIVERPLAAVIAANRDRVRRPSDLEGATVGVTGLPSDDAVLDSVIARRRRRSVLASTGSRSAFRRSRRWRPERSTPRPRSGTPRGSRCAGWESRSREFRVDRYGAPRYPELILCTTSKLIAADPGLVRSVRRGDPTRLSPRRPAIRDRRWAPCSTARRASIRAEQRPSLRAARRRMRSARPPARAAR